MVAHLLLSASLLAGVGSSQRVGEVSPFAMVTAQASHRAISVEATWDGADKVETGDGWLASGAADWRTGPLTIGAAVSHRETSRWSKTVGWARAGIRSGPLWFIASVAPTSPNQEVKAEARLTLRSQWLVVEPRAWVEWHSTSHALGGPGYGVEMLVGVGN